MVQGYWMHSLERDLGLCGVCVEQLYGDLQHEPVQLRGDQSDLPLEFSLVGAGGWELD